MVVVICSDASVVEAVETALERGVKKTGARKERSNVSFRIFFCVKSTCDQRVDLTHRKSFVRLAMGAFPQVLAIP